jgi:hypothetical protein
METNLEQIFEKKHNTASTSRESYQVLLNTNKLIDQKKAIYQAITIHQPVTSRRLAQLTGQERSSVCRSLYDLLNEINPSIRVCFIDRCPKTKRNVKHYSLISWKPDLFTSTSQVYEA